MEIASFLSIDKHRQFYFLTMFARRMLKESFMQDATDIISLWNDKKMARFCRDYKDGSLLFYSDVNFWWWQIKNQTSLNWECPFIE